MTMKVMQACDQFFFLPCNREKKFARCARILGNWMLQIAMLITAVNFSFCNEIKKKKKEFARLYMVTGCFKLQCFKHSCKILGALGAQNSDFSEK